MSEFPGRHTTRIFRRSRSQWIGIGILSVLLVGCDAGETPSPAGEAESLKPAAAEAPQPLATLTFPNELRAQHPEVSRFLDDFLGAWRTGEYERYRQLVGRAHTPESRERFEAICAATEAVTVVGIEPIDSAQVPPPVFRVVFEVEVSPEREVRPGERRRKVALLVFKELGQWRMAPAPAELQPVEEPPPPATSSAPTTSAPSYPWDEEGDY
jgi:hypothetical protein